MNALYTAAISTVYGTKSIEVYACDVLAFDDPIDVLTTSAFRRTYAPTPRTLFQALDSIGISVQHLAKEPLIDLRSLCNVWLSKSTNMRLGRIGCIEMTCYDPTAIGVVADEKALLSSIHAYFQMLDMAADCGVEMDTVAMPLLGTGSQSISAGLMLLPILNECTAFLKRNPAVRRLCFIERNPAKAKLISDALKESYSILQETEMAQQPQRKPEVQQPLAFISYASEDKNVADNLCAKLENNGIKVWYAPRNVSGDYAGAITRAIENATHFVLILSRHSIQSQHVLNEIDLAFKKLPDRVRFKPLRLDETLFTPSFEYYLSRQHWMDAFHPPLEERLCEFVDGILQEH